ncbi:unnamed protein product [Adineta steineri]|uniref:DUF1349 domain-containing protein n=1 Tax=Adineta steineri TaxID=433720 RepID=A0A819FSJ2_9BILA|nr:unnamed protein product [Adineta steineri]
MCSLTGAERDNGHFYYRSLPGDEKFLVTVNVQGKYNARYDQGGLMLRIDEKNWIKCGVEYVDDKVTPLVDGKQFASVVVTVNGWSDWSIVSTDSPDVLKLRVGREKEAIHIEYAEGENGEFKMMRLAYFPVIDEKQSLMVGIMCASPYKDSHGFDVEFEKFNII